jgi:hypothetical protein
MTIEAFQVDPQKRYGAGRSVATGGIQGRFGSVPTAPPTFKLQASQVGSRDKPETIRLSSTGRHPLDTRLTHQGLHHRRLRYYIKSQMMFIKCFWQGVWSISSSLG